MQQQTGQFSPDGYWMWNGAQFTGGIAAVLDLIGAIGLVAAAVLCVMVIREVTARQERKNQLIASGHLI